MQTLFYLLRRSQLPISQNWICCVDTGHLNIVHVKVKKKIYRGIIRASIIIDSNQAKL
jgi:hypothetical protein